MCPERKCCLQGGDELYLKILLDPIKTCAEYKPRFGQGTPSGGLTLQQFQSLYKADSLYGWLGLDNPMMYTAHRAAGGMTSLYRQIGIGCERLFRTILKDTLNLSDEDVIWSYDVHLASGKKRTLHLDGRIPLDRIADKGKQEKIFAWMQESTKKIGVDPGVAATLKGMIFEVRQGYKSKDAKRQNADIANAATAYTQSYLPCAAILSTQIDTDISDRYRREKWMLLTGVVGTNDSLISVYDFMRDVIGYDLASFFERNSPTLRKAVEDILRVLLT